MEDWRVVKWVASWNKVFIIIIISSMNEIQLYKYILISVGLHLFRSYAEGIVWSWKQAGHNLRQLFTNRL